jgi:hypothetical protein
MVIYSCLLLGALYFLSFTHPSLPSRSSGNKCDACSITAVFSLQILREESAAAVTSAANNQWDTPTNVVPPPDIKLVQVSGIGVTQLREGNRWDEPNNAEPQRE